MFFAKEIMREDIKCSGEESDELLAIILLLFLAELFVDSNLALRTPGPHDLAVLNNLSFIFLKLV